MSDALGSWRDGPAKRALLDFVARVTNEVGPDYVPPAERIATFDNDGTLCCEHPVPAQLYFTLHQMRRLAAKAPGIADRQPYKALLERDLATISSLGKEAAFRIGMTVYAGVTEEEFDLVVRGWFATAKHPRLGWSFEHCVYAPQMELLDYLRVKRFKIYIVTSDEAEFIRPFAEQAYGIPREQVIGSAVKLRVERQSGRSVLLKSSELETFDDHEEKVRNIGTRIGRRPILAFGNSDGDLAMLRYTRSGFGPRLALLLHHDDRDREVAYDREHRLSPLSEALDNADDYGLTVVSMKHDWKTVFGAVVTPLRRTA